MSVAYSGPPARYVPVMAEQEREVEFEELPPKREQTKVGTVKAAKVGKAVGARRQTGR